MSNILKNYLEKIKTITTKDKEGRGAPDFLATQHSLL